MSGGVTRRALFARLRGGGAQLRPPWSLPEPAFTDACTLCAKCIEACPTRLLTRGHAGYPIADFTRGTCTFCGACAEACAHGCFGARDGAARPWPLVAAISQACVEPKGVTCRICQEACEAGAIRFQPLPQGRARAVVSQDACTGCGNCLAGCPVKAISITTPAPAGRAMQEASV